jgi:uncharacterized membrane protein
MTAGPGFRPLLSAGLLLGAGLGGFLDGIVLHQVLQWHNLFSSRVPPTDVVSIKYNMLWDGIFHLLTWLMTCAGLAVLWRAGLRRGTDWSTRSFVGSLLLGWGAFNLIEGLLDHHLLELHHVHPGVDEAGWDIGFLVFGAMLAAAGWTMIRSIDRPRASAARAVSAVE